MNRRQFGLLAGVAGAGAFASPTTPAGMKRLKITRVRTVEVRDVTTGKGLVLPWDPKKIPESTRDYMVTQFFTDQGVVGTAMDGNHKLPPGIGAEVQRLAEAYFVGKDPFDLAIHNAEFFEKQKAPVKLFFLEVGLWDIIGQVAGQPLYKLWGAATDRVQAYASTVHFYKTPEERAEDAHRFYELGFRAIKVRLHHEDPRDDLKLASTVKKAVGDKMQVMVDANMADKKKGDPPPVWDYETASMMARELEQMGIYWLEEPLNRFAYDDLARVRGQLKTMHLAGGEGNVGLKDFRDILTKGALDYIQPDPMIGGPVSVIRKIAAMGEAFGARFAPHHGRSGVGMIADLHMQCAAPNTGYIEYMYDPGYWNAVGFQAGFAATYPIDKDGYLHAPQAPGLGIDWDPKFVRTYGLHNERRLAPRSSVK